MSKMSKAMVKACMAAAVVAAASAGFTAQEARVLNVTATIPGGCTLTTSAPMAFGTLNMASTGPETQEVTVTYKCATGINVTSFTVGGLTTGPFTGSMTGLGPTPDTIPYSISWTPPAPYTGEGFAAAGRQVLLNGTIQNADYISKKPDNYAHSVVLAINF